LIVTISGHQAGIVANQRRNSWMAAGQPERNASTQQCLQFSAFGGAEHLEQSAVSFGQAFAAASTDLGGPGSG